MAAIVTTQSIRVYLALHNGGTSTVNISLGNINKNAFDPAKVINIVNLLEPCLEKSVYGIYKIENSLITDE